MRRPRDKDIDYSDIPEWTEEDFKRARHFTSEERAMFRQAYTNTFGHPPPKRGPLHKHPSKRYVPTSIKLHPKVIQWARTQAKRRGIGYQTFINQTLLDHAA
jgi:hypothetical protein